MDSTKYILNRFADWQAIGAKSTNKDEFKTPPRTHTHICTRLESVGVYSGQFCAVFYTDAITKRCLDSSRGHFIPCYSFNSDIVELSGGRNNLNQAMFVSIVNISQIKECIIPCLVRLQALNQCPLRDWQPSDMSSDAILKIPVGRIDRESDIAIETRISQKPQLPQEMIKAGTQVAANITDGEGIIGRNRLSLVNPEDYLACIDLTYELRNNSVRVVLREPLSYLIKSFEMLLCSAELEEWAIQRVHG